MLAGAPPADVDAWWARFDDVAQEPLSDEDGGDQADVVQMDAARKRVVRDQHVARAERAEAVVADGARDLLDHRAEVHRLGEALGHRPELGVEERAGEVGAGLDVRRIGAAPEGQDHLVGRRDEGVPDHLEHDRVGGHGRHADARSTTTP